MIVIALAAWTFLLSVLVNFCPGAGGSVPFVVGLQPAAYALVALIAALTLAELKGSLDLAAPDSPYPSHLRLLPVNSWVLALWPQAYGAFILVVGWACFAKCVMAPAGHPVPEWPGFMLACISAWIQGLAWTPIGPRYLRLILMIVVLCALVVAPIAAVMEFGRAWANAGLPWIYAFLICLAFPVAVRGIAAGRCGIAPPEQWLPGRTNSAVRTLPRFSSALTAQIWFCWRTLGNPLAIMTAVTSAALWLGSLIPFRVPLAGIDSNAATGLGAIQVNLWQMLFPGTLLLPVWFASICGIQGELASQRADSSLSPFDAARPLSTSRLVAAKFLTVALSTALAWAIMGVFATVWFLSSAVDRGHSAALGTLLLKYASSKSVFLAVVALVGLICLTWRRLAESVTVGLMGHPWIRPVLVVFQFMFIPMAAVLIGLYGNALMKLAEAVPQWILVAVCLKAAGGAYVILLQREVRLADFRLVSISVLVWLAGGAGTCAFMELWFPTGLYPIWLTAAIGLLFSPLVRITAAPLALYWNRHR
jgi:hypothetical protein